MKLLAFFTSTLLAGYCLASEPIETTGWHPAAGSLMTRWAAEVSPTNAHPEYPRPQMVRSNWLNLNGLWNYAVAPQRVATISNFEGQILVPFPIESALSGVKRSLDDKSTLWYERRFTVPTEWRGQRVRLHFGAVDWQASVTINGRGVGQHRGGYDGFSFDITDELKWKGDEEIIVAVTDPTDGDQPRGKQSRKPEGIFYTSTSGIWQTVWLEPVPEVCIDGLTLTPDVDANVLRLNVAVNSLSDSLKVEAIAYANGQEIGRVVGSPNSTTNLRVRSPHLWSPDDPFLYDLRVTLRDRDRVVDSVSSYFGMRKIALRKDADGVTRMALNDQSVFEIGALDQGFWPDGIYTAPTDEALRFDIEYLNRAGFNLARKHVKVEPDRWYYWCDKLGLLVWQDMPSRDDTTPAGRIQFEIELQRMVEGRRNHPSIIMWVLFNEGWGQYDTERLVSWLKAMDSSRLVDNASGWTDKRVGDVIDIHSYPGPDYPRPESSSREGERAAVLGEFGGLGLRLPGHMWSTNFWAYKLMTNLPTLNEQAGRLLEAVHILRERYGLSAAVYTQTADVETECNGLLTYDRAITKLDPAVAAAANSINREGYTRVIVPNALYARVIWKYTTNQPDGEWMKPGYDDSKWQTGVGGFGTEGTPGAIVNTVWNTGDIWLRRDFTLNTQDLRGAGIQLHHDEDAEVYLNGVLATKLPGYITTYEEVPMDPEALAALKNDTNLMAVHCHQTTGGQFIDVGIIIPHTANSTEAAK